MHTGFKLPRNNLILTIQHQKANHLCNSKAALSIDQLHLLPMLNNKEQSKIEKSISMAIFHLERVLDRFLIVEATPKARGRAVSQL